MDPTQIPLRGLHLPDAVGWWPLAPGWWLVIALLVLGFGLLLRNALQRRSRSAARRHALRQLAQYTSAFAEHGNAITLGIEVSELLRRAMLAYAPRADVAGLTGEAWLAWLDRDLAQPQFLKGAGRTLLDLPYRNPASVGQPADLEGMLAAVRERLKTPVGGRA
jgi:hypothetical protein